MAKNNPFGDDGGARIGKPDTPDRDNRKPDKRTSDQGDGATTGAGQEATRGVREKNDQGSPTRPGSEPLEDRDKQHKSGYGGEGGAPRTSSDQR